MAWSVWKQGQQGEREGEMTCFSAPFTKLLVDFRTMSMRCRLPRTESRKVQSCLKHVFSGTFHALENNISACLFDRCMVGFSLYTSVSFDWFIVLVNYDESMIILILDHLSELKLLKAALCYKLCLHHMQPGISFNYELLKLVNSITAQTSRLKFMRY